MKRELRVECEHERRDTLTVQVFNNDTLYVSCEESGDEATISLSREDAKRVALVLFEWGMSDGK